ncbi:MAG: GNAT family N-acetyltransferase [Candidatus Solibacter sp.]
MDIRDATEADLPAVLRILADSGIDGGESFTLAEARQHFAKIREQPGFRLLVAVVEGEIAGTYVLQFMQKLGKRGTPAGVVEDVAVAPGRQGQGIGRAMMVHAREACRQAGCYKLALSSNVGREDAHRFYEALGFERHGFSFVTRC